MLMLMNLQLGLLLNLGNTHGEVIIKLLFKQDTWIGTNAIVTKDVLENTFVTDSSTKVIKRSV